MALFPGIRKFINERFNEELRFFKGWMDNTKAVGAILPTSMITARSMASVINPGSGLPVLELGPGTGVITRAILQRGVSPEKLYSVEYSEDFVDHLRVEFPMVHVIQGDAFDLDEALGDDRDLKFDAVISAVPLLNFPMSRRVAMIDDLLSRMPAGRPVVQITYGAVSPVRPGDGDFSVKHHDFVLRNAPPANLWLYRRGD